MQRGPKSDSVLGDSVTPLLDNPNGFMLSLSVLLATVGELEAIVVELSSMSVAVVILSFLRSTGSGV